MYLTASECIGFNFISERTDVKLFNITMYNVKCLEARMNIIQLLVSFEKIPSFSFKRSSKLGRHLGDVGG